MNIRSIMVERRSRRKMTVEELFTSDQYRSIIVLTDVYGNKKGLRQLHYRWVLIKYHDNIKQLLQPFFIREMKHLFEKEKDTFRKIGYSNKLDQLYKEKSLVKNCITSNSNLSNFLKRLSNPPYNILIRFDEDGLPKYKLTEYGKEQVKRWQLHRLVKSLDKSILDDVEKAIYNVIDKKVEKSVKVNFRYNKFMN